MKLAVIVLSMAAVTASAPAVFASTKTPGHVMQKHAKKNDRHAPSYAQARMRDDRGKTGSPGVPGNSPKGSEEYMHEIGGGGGGGGGGGSM